MVIRKCAARDLSTLPGDSQLFVGPIRERKAFTELGNGLRAYHSRKWPGMYIVKMRKAVWMLHLKEPDLWLLGHWLTEWAPLLTGNYMIVNETMKHDKLKDVVARGPMGLAALRVKGAV